MRRKSLLTTLGIIINFYVFCLATPDLQRLFYCDKKIIDFKAVERAKRHACNGLSGSYWWSKFPATLSGSEIFRIDDAILFVWPLNLGSNHEFNEGGAATERVVIDSQCNFIGLIKRIDETYQRCIQPVDPNYRPTHLPMFPMEDQPKQYGYKCSNEIIPETDLKRTYDYIYNHWSKLQNSGQEPSGNLQGQTTESSRYEKFWTWPIRIKKRESKSPDYPPDRFRAAISQLDKSLALIYKDEDRWKKCDGIYYLDPEPPRLSEDTKTSVGETIYEGISAFRCGNDKFSATTVNSHIQAGCNRVRSLVNPRGINTYEFPRSPENIQYKSKPVWHWPLRRFETNDRSSSKYPLRTTLKYTDHVGT
ncbi:putative secreted effector protein [Blumeria graminis f. sp. tritici 96224]|uniref:Putative secreted effector protein n=1 Tax=Blumeria graminis f. sp. tritici 96224 TaxID=1268274 RepID=A0A656KE96_BLUGR|nr:putative secreted effector protein [Blumeria graminis f. sp. tritici 96224]